MELVHGGPEPVGRVVDAQVADPVIQIVQADDTEGVRVPLLGLQDQEPGGLKGLGAVGIVVDGDAAAVKGHRRQPGAVHVAGPDIDRVQGTGGLFIDVGEPVVILLVNAAGESVLQAAQKQKQKQQKSQGPDQIKFSHLRLPQNCS